MYNKKAIQEALAKLNSAKKPKQEPDIIVDPAGQWKHPGLPTRIPSNNITMQGVPYPVLGVDNLGNQQMMYPGAEYTFPEADYVDEFPMMQSGGGKKATAADSLAVLQSALDVSNYYKNKNYSLDDSYDKVNEKGSPTEELYRDKLSSFWLNEHKKDYEDELKTARKYPIPENAEGYWNNKYRTGPKKGEFIPFEDYFKQINAYQYKQREEKNNILDTRSPMPLYDTRIYPSGQIFLTNKNKNDPYFKDQVTFPVYDPLAVTPWKHLSEEDKKLRLKVYGSQGTPVPGHSVNSELVNKRLQELYKSSGKSYEPNLNTDLAAWLKTQKAPTSYADRKKLYQQATGKDDYKGSAEQNISLLNLLKEKGLDYKVDLSNNTDDNINILGEDTPFPNQPEGPGLTRTITRMPSSLATKEQKVSPTGLTEQVPEKTNLYKPTAIGEGPLISYDELKEKHPQLYQTVVDNYNKNADKWNSADEFFESKLKVKPGKELYTGTKTWEELLNACPECLLWDGIHYEKDDKGAIYKVTNTPSYPKEYWENVFSSKEPEHLKNLFTIEDGTSQSKLDKINTKPEHRYHREWNPFTKEYEPMSPQQHKMLEREYYKLQNSGISNPTVENIPQFEPELLDVVTRKKVPAPKTLQDQDLFNQAQLKYGGLVTGLKNTSGNLLMNKKGKRLMAQSGSLSATNELFLGNPLVTKRKKAVFVPGAAFQKGGSIDLELTDKEIEQYKKGGFIVEELPKAQDGKNLPRRKVVKPSSLDDIGKYHDPFYQQPSDRLGSTPRIVDAGLQKDLDVIEVAQEIKKQDPSVSSEQALKNAYFVVNKPEEVHPTISSPEAAVMAPGNKEFSEKVLDDSYTFADYMKAPLDILATGWVADDETRQQRRFNRYNPELSATERFSNTAQEALGLGVQAGLNLAITRGVLPQGTSALRTVAESVSPYVPSKAGVNRFTQQTGDYLTTQNWSKGYGSNTPKQLPGSGNVDEMINLFSRKNKNFVSNTNLSNQNRMNYDENEVLPLNRRLITEQEKVNNYKNVVYEDYTSDIIVPPSYQKAHDDAVGFAKKWGYDEDKLKIYNEKRKSLDPTLNEEQLIQRKKFDDLYEELDKIDPKKTPNNIMKDRPDLRKRWDDLIQEGKDLEERERLRNLKWMEIESDFSFLDPIFKEKADYFTNSQMTFPDYNMPEQHRKNLLVTPLKNHESLKNLIPEEIDYILNKPISGVRNQNNTLTLTHSNNPVSSYFELPNKKPFNLFNPKTWTGKAFDKPTLIERRSLKANSLDDIAETAAHETGHDLQHVGNFFRDMAKYDSEYGYYVNKGESDLARRFRDAMVEPVKLTDSNQKYNYETWLANPKELHSELMAARLKLFNSYRYHTNLSDDAIIKIIKQDRPNNLEWLLEHGDLNKHFKKSTSKKEKLELIKLLPALVPAAIGTGAALNSNAQENTQYQQGGIILDLSDDEIRKYQEAGYVIEEM